MKNKTILKALFLTAGCAVVVYLGTMPEFGPTAAMFPALGCVFCLMLMVFIFQPRWANIQVDSHSNIIARIGAKIMAFPWRLENQKMAFVMGVAIIGGVVAIQVGLKGQSVISALAVVSFFLPPLLFSAWYFGWLSPSDTHGRDAIKSDA